LSKIKIKLFLGKNLRKLSFKHNSYYIISLFNLLSCVYHTSLFCSHPINHVHKKKTGVFANIITLVTFTGAY